MNKFPFLSSEGRSLKVVFFSMQENLCPDRNNSSSTEPAVTPLLSVETRKALLPKENLETESVSLKDGISMVMRLADDVKGTPSKSEREQTLTPNCVRKKIVAESNSFVDYENKDDIKFKAQHR